jgi:hypothetical protein
VPGFIPWAWTKQNNFWGVIHIHILLTNAAMTWASWK